MAEIVNFPSKDFFKKPDDTEGMGILEDLSRRFTKTTPDFIDRKLEGTIPVFVYGTLREGFHNHGHLKGMPYLGRGQTTIETYEMREVHGGSFPLVYKHPMKTGKKKDPRCGKIQGEVYVVDVKTLLSLDVLENNGTMYNRQMEWIFLEDQRQRENSNLSPSIKCWIYLGDSKFWQGRDGEPVVSSRKNGWKNYDWVDSWSQDYKAYDSYNH